MDEAALLELIEKRGMEALIEDYLLSAVGFAAKGLRAFFVASPGTSPKPTAAEPKAPRR